MDYYKKIKKDSPIQRGDILFRTGKTNHSGSIKKEEEYAVSQVFRNHSGCLTRIRVYTQNSTTTWTIDYSYFCNWLFRKNQTSDEEYLERLTGGIK